MDLYLCCHFSGISGGKNHILKDDIFISQEGEILYLKEKCVEWNNIRKTRNYGETSSIIQGSESGLTSWLISFTVYTVVYCVVVTSGFTTVSNRPQACKLMHCFENCIFYPSF